jgi:hypothetical protein
LSLRQKIIVTGIAVYVVLHLIVAIFSIRVWPFTDYPMFADVFYKDSPLATIRYRLILIDGKSQPMPRSFAHGFSVNEKNLTKLFRDGNLDAVKRIFSQWLREHKDPVQVKEIHVVKVSAQRTPDGKFFFQEELVHSFPIEDLL